MDAPKPALARRQRRRAQAKDHDAAGRTGRAGTGPRPLLPDARPRHGLEPGGSRGPAWPAPSGLLPRRQHVPPRAHPFRPGPGAVSPGGGGGRLRQRHHGAVGRAARKAGANGALWLAQAETALDGKAGRPAAPKGRAGMIAVFGRFRGAGGGPAATSRQREGACGKVPSGRVSRHPPSCGRAERKRREPAAFPCSGRCSAFWSVR